MKIVINKCYGGFSLSRKAFLLLRKMKNKHALEEPDIGEFWSDGSGPREIDNPFLRDIPRDDKDLIKVIKKLKDKANGDCAELRIVEIPNNADWEIDEYDGLETVEEKHRIWS
jgi:hypothetical protein